MHMYGGFARAPTHPIFNMPSYLWDTAIMIHAVHKPTQAVYDTTPRHSQVHLAVR